MNKKSGKKFDFFFFCVILSIPILYFNKLMMAEKMQENHLNNKMSKTSKVKKTFSKELFLDLLYDKWDQYDKLANTYAYKLMEENERPDEVIDHLEKFTPTRKLFEELVWWYIFEELDIIDFVDYFKGEGIVVRKDVIDDLVEAGQFNYLGDYEDFNFQISEDEYNKLKKKSERNKESLMAQEYEDAMDAQFLRDIEKYNEWEDVDLTRYL